MTNLNKKSSTQVKEINKLIKSEGLNEEAAKLYIADSLKHGYPRYVGEELNNILSRFRPLNLGDIAKKRRVYIKIYGLIKRFGVINKDFILSDYY